MTTPSIIRVIRAVDFASFAKAGEPLLIQGSELVCRNTIVDSETPGSVWVDSETPGNIKVNSEGAE